MGAGAPSVLFWDMGEDREDLAWRERRREILQSAYRRRQSSGEREGGSAGLLAAAVTYKKRVEEMFLTCMRIRANYRKGN